MLRPEEEFRLARDGSAAARRMHGGQTLPRKSPLPVDEKQEAAGAQDHRLDDAHQAREGVHHGSGQAHRVPGRLRLRHSWNKTISTRFDTSVNHSVQ